MDAGHILTDKEIKKLEKRIRKEYKQAASEMEKKLKKHMEQFAVRDAEQKALVKAGEITRKEYLDWRQNAMMRNKQWQALRKNLAQDMRNADKIAKSIANGHMPEVYALNYNFGTYEVEKGLSINTNFALYNRQTVERILRDDPDILPEPGKRMRKKLQDGKALKWQEGQIQSVALQSILQGESIPHTAKRIADVLGVQGYKTGVRYARTAMTGAQNAGRRDAYNRARELGIDLENEWMATPDDRVRESHADADGERRKDGERFSTGCLYPGDPTGPAEEVWNCRCTLVAAIKGYKYNDDRFTRLPDGMSFEDWKKYHDKN